jgi:hypothetical protein
MNRNIIVNNLSFNFKLIEGGDSWHLGKDLVNIINYNNLNVYIEYNNPNWEDVRSFLKELLENKNLFKQLVISSEKILSCFFEEIISGKNIQAPKDLCFTLNSISFKGFESASSKEYVYEFSFYLESLSDLSFTSYDSWNSLIVGSNIRGVNNVS